MEALTGQERFFFRDPARLARYEAICRELEGITFLLTGKTDLLYLDDRPTRLDCTVAAELPHMGLGFAPFWDLAWAFLAADRVELIPTPEKTLVAAFTVEKVYVECTGDPEEEEPREA